MSLSDRQGMDRKTVAIQIGRARRALDHELLMSHLLGVSVSNPQTDGLADEIQRLAALHPSLTLADVEAERDSL